MPNSGWPVVTMDEWGQVGTLPVVIYGIKGRLVKVHSLESLGLYPEDVTHVKYTVSSRWWNEDALVFFGPKAEELVIRLHWGKVLIINLWDGDLITESEYPHQQRWQQLQGFIAGKSKELAFKLLRSAEPDDRKTGAIHAGHLRIKEALPILRELLTDDAAHEVWSYDVRDVKEVRIVYYVRKAARDALEAMGEPVTGVVVEAPIASGDDTEED